MVRKFFSLKHMDMTLEPIEGDILEKKENREEGMSYHQMRLPIEKITKEFEVCLRRKVASEIQALKTHIAGEDELENVVEVYNQAWTTSNTPFKILDLETVKRLYHEYRYTFLLAKLNNEYCGFAILDYYGDADDYGIIIGMGIVPKYQRMGMGTALGISIWELFKEHEVQEIRCEVYINNKKSYRFIKSLGFEEYDMKTYFN
ncbi:MAG: GNAT family N-acetyltransferase [Promethearchaeota archaeon]